MLGNDYPQIQPSHHRLNLLLHWQIWHSYCPGRQPDSSMGVVLPYNPHVAKRSEEDLHYDIETSFRIAPTLKKLLCNTYVLQSSIWSMCTSSKSDPKRTADCIYKLCCPDFYVGQTYSPISLHIRETSYDLNNIYYSAK